MASLGADNKRAAASMAVADENSMEPSVEQMACERRIRVYPHHKKNGSKENAKSKNKN